jgi:hypothetical protein
MKKFLLSCALLATTFAFSQNTLPCVGSYGSSSAGGGNCPTAGTGQNAGYPGYLDIAANTNYKPSGKIVVYFKSSIPVGVAAPAILAAGPQDATTSDIQAGQAFPYVYRPFNDDQSQARMSITYCFYTNNPNQNIFNGANAPLLAFQIKYITTLGNTTTPQNFVCGSVVENSTLPVSFTSFTAARNRQTVNLKWETANEANNSGFNIQRLIGNGNWETVAFVPTQAVSGNSTSLLTYTFNDLNTVKAVSQYRIQQVDVDGRSKYSEIRSVRADEIKNTVLLYPNPSNTGKVNVVFDNANGLHDVLVSDATGRTVKTFKGISTNNVAIEGLNEGFYSVQVIDRTTNAVQVEKIVIQKR